MRDFQKLSSVHDELCGMSYPKTHQKTDAIFGSAIIASLLICASVLSLSTVKVNFAFADEIVQNISEVAESVSAKLQNFQEKQDLVAPDSDVSQIISEDEIKFIDQNLGKDVGNSIRGAIDISKMDSKRDMPFDQNVDISNFPYSPETGELQFSSISWANLGSMPSKIQVQWENPDGTTGEAEMSDGADWVWMNQTYHLSLSDVKSKTQGTPLQNGANFRYYVQLSIGFDSDWSRWYSYDSSSDFAVGCHSDKGPFTRKYIPLALTYGSADTTKNLTNAIAKKNKANILKIVGLQATSLIVGVGTSIGLGLAGAYCGSKIMIMLGAATGIATSVIMLAADVALTAVTSDIEVEEVDLSKKTREKYWIPNSVDDPTGSGHFAVSGFQFVSNGYYWSKPMVHWRGKKELKGTDHKAYVNETLNGKNKNGVRMGKASGLDLADLSRKTIFDVNDKSVTLQEGDYVWFGAEVSLGKDRVATDEFIYSRDGYIGGYLAQGTTLMDRKSGADPKAYLVAFGLASEVSLDMQEYVTTAKALFQEMAIKIAVGAAIIAVTTAVSILFARMQINKLNEGLELQNQTETGSLDNSTQEKKVTFIGSAQIGDTVITVEDEEELGVVRRYYRERSGDFRFFSQGGMYYAYHYPGGEPSVALIQALNQGITVNVMPILRGAPANLAPIISVNSRESYQTWVVNIYSHWV